MFEFQPSPARVPASEVVPDLSLVTGTPISRPRTVPLTQAVDFIVSTVLSEYFKVSVAPTLPTFCAGYDWVGAVWLRDSATKLAQPYFTSVVIPEVVMPEKVSFTPKQITRATSIAAILRKAFRPYKDEYRAQHGYTRQYEAMKTFLELVVIQCSELCKEINSQEIVRETTKGLSTEDLLIRLREEKTFEGFARLLPKIAFETLKTEIDGTPSKRFAYLSASWSLKLPDARLEIDSLNGSFFESFVEYPVVRSTKVAERVADVMEKGTVISKSGMLSVEDAEKIFGRGLADLLYSNRDICLRSMPLQASGKNFGSMVFTIQLAVDQLRPGHPELRRIEHLITEAGVLALKLGQKLLAAHLQKQAEEGKAKVEEPFDEFPDEGSEELIE